MSLVCNEDGVPLPVAYRSSREQRAKLFELMTNRDKRAHEVFYNSTSGLVFGILLHILPNTHIAEAVLPQIYKELSRKARGFTQQSDPPLTWLILIVHRKGVERLCSEVMHQAARRLTTHTSELATERPVINITAQRRVIRTGLSAIPYSERRLLELAFFSGMSNIEIAKHLAFSPEAINESLIAGMRSVFGVVKSMQFPPLTTTMSE